VGNSWRRLLFHPKGLLAVMVVSCGFAGNVTGGVLIWRDYSDSRRQTEAAGREAAHLFEEHVDRAIDGAELVALWFAERAVADGGMARAVATPGARASLEAMVRAVPAVGNITLVDAEGRVAFDLGGFHPPGTSLVDRDWVAALRDGGRDGFIGKVLFDQSRGSYSFTAARRVISADGSFLGVVGAAVEVGYLAKFFESLPAAADSTLGIYRLDGEALARLPLRIDDIDRTMAGDPLFVEHLSQSPDGSYSDQWSRLVSYRTVESRELVVWVAQGDGEAMAQWRQRSLRTALVLGAMFAVTAALSWLLAGRIGREYEAAAQLAQVNLDLKRSNADLEQFAYIASHDLKEPLRNIASYVQLLQRRYHGRLDPDADAFIGYTVEGVRRMQTIINELLAYSRIGTARPELAPVQAGATVSAALSALKNVIAEAQAVVEVESKLPVVMADGPQLTSLFQNLIGNGLKYRRDDARPEVAVGCEDGGSQWLFHVRDNGIGIDPQYHEQIFEVFKRLHARDRYSGSGIGLAICKRVVERHGGRIWVTSEPGKGSTFWFTMNKAEAPDA
jgi:signal transduction histidine kinase